MTTTTMTATDGPSSSDERKRQQLRRSKSVAAGLLLVAAAVFAVSTYALKHGGPEWLAFVQAAAEAGMVGGLADWFAVTALFRHPLGIPIPHTAIIPTRKDQMGASLGEFVGTNFLAEDVITEKVRSLDIAHRLGTWLAVPANAERVTAELASAAGGVLSVLGDDEVKATIEGTLREKLASAQLGPPLGRLLEQVVADGAHHPLVEVLVSRGREWLVENRATIMDIVSSQAPEWSPKFADEMIASRVHNELVKFVTAIHDDPNHQVRRSIDRMLQELSWDLRHDPAMQQRVDAAKLRVLEHPETKQAVSGLWLSARAMLVEAIESPDSELRRRVAGALGDFGAKVAGEEASRSKADRLIENAVLHLVSNYRGELTAVITDTVARWDGQETARKIELQVGRDLQFIRINGTLVGALAGLAIHTISVLIAGS